MQSVSDFIEACGGASKVAKARNLPPSTVASWKARGSIPIEQWPPLLELAQECGVGEVTYEKLVTLHADQRVSS